jgi:hypothetical protein
MVSMNRVGGIASNGLAVLVEHDTSLTREVTPATESARLNSTVQFGTAQEQDTCHGISMVEPTWQLSWPTRHNEHH